LKAGWGDDHRNFRRWTRQDSTPPDLLPCTKKKREGEGEGEGESESESERVREREREKERGQSRDHIVSPTIWGTFLYITSCTLNAPLMPIHKPFGFFILSFLHVTEMLSSRPDTF